MYHLFKHLLFRINPETAHNFAILALKSNVLFQKVNKYQTLEIELWGKKFAHPIGLAAGFDKDARCISPLLKQGFSFIEVGTVTPYAQIGNPKPRLFRLEQDRAIINRMGFNNKGAGPFLKKLKQPRMGIVGANIGKNKYTNDPAKDYIELLSQFYSYSDYITINISSPNTPGLRDLHHANQLKEFLQKIMGKRAELLTTYHKKIPIVVKISPDISEEEIESIAHISLELGVDGLIISNTTTRRDHLINDIKQEGGLSGRPLFYPSTKLLAKFYQLTKGRITLIASGGVFSGDDAYTKILAGASLVQIYTAIIYEGFGIIEKIKHQLDLRLKQDGYNSISEAIGKGIVK